MRVARLHTASGDHYAIAQTDGWALVDDPFAESVRRTGEVVPMAGARLLAPVVPRVVIGIAHNRTNNHHPLPMQAWHKSVRSVCGTGDEVPIRSTIGAINIEGELAVIIGRPAYRLTPENALDAVFGYTIANDVTNVDQVAIDERFFHVKSGVNYAPIGPWIETDIGDPDDVSITVTINGVVRAESGTNNLPSGIVDCLVYATSWLELGPGDVLLTGAPATFLPTKVGDVVEIALEGIGTLTNTIVSEAARD